MISEFLSRMWWFLENPNNGYKFVFISPDDNIAFLDFFLMLGLREEDIILLKEPVRFNSIIIPDQASYLYSGYTDKSIEIFNAIRDSVTPATYEKVYLTRTKLARTDVINEKYFENNYAALGYEIIAPEKLSIRDQVAVMAGVKEIACVSGTLAHQVLFCQDDVTITILPKNNAPLMQQFTVNNMRRANYTIVDVSMNFMPTPSFNSVSLFMPTTHWHQYVSGKKPSIPQKYDISIHTAVMDYLTKWAAMSARGDKVALGGLRKFTLADVIIGIHKYFLQENLGVNVMKKLREAFPRPE